VILAELGGKGNPRIMRYWEDYATSVYIVTLWDYTITVRTRAQAAQLLYALKNIRR
jgi:hypothetical protein